jgi:hypothetical protein
MGAWIPQIAAWIVYLILHGIRGGFHNSGDVLSVPVLLLGPPIALFLFGIAAGWAFRGFKTDNDESGSGA